jgi:4-aminobutyrate aminotransferase-like enzyme
VDEALVIARANDQQVWDADGNQYLDSFGGIVTISVGHANARVNRRLREQIDRLQHVSTPFATEPLAALAKEIASITPEGRLTKSFFTNSGSEAEATARIMEAARENRLLAGQGGLYGNVLRIAPPLNISRTDIDEFAGLLEASFKGA